MNICVLDAKTLGDNLDLSKIEAFGNLTVYQTTSACEVIERIKEQDIVITNKVVLNHSNLSFAKNLKLICVAATGTNNIDLEFTRFKNIAVTNVAGYSTDSVAQHTFAMLFYLLEHLAYYDKYVKSNEYSKSDIFTHIQRPFSEIKSKTWGIIGLGTIGKTVAGIAEGFGCEVVYYSTTGKNNESRYQSMQLEQLLSLADIVSIHAPLTEKTKYLFNYDVLSRMRKTAILLNLGRGPIINEAHLARALDEELIAGAGLDVLENEPMNEDNPLLKIKNKDRLIITPHIAWASTEARIRLINEIAGNIDAFLKGISRNRVDL